MKWTKATIMTTVDAIDFITVMLDELGIEGVEIEDKRGITEEEKEEMYINILPEAEEDDGSAKVSFYVNILSENPEDGKDYGNAVENHREFAGLMKKVEEGLKELRGFVDIGDCSIVITDTKDEDWINNWKKFFKPFRISDRIVIKPAWIEFEAAGSGETNAEGNSGTGTNAEGNSRTGTAAEESAGSDIRVKEDDIVVEMDPGISFGTGSHETTKLPILMLEEYLKDGMRILDVGCGSGILSIIGIKLCGGKAVMTDIDRHAITAAKENMDRNNIPEDSYSIEFGNIITDEEFAAKIGEEKYDIVVANILADVIMPLSGKVGPLLKPDGIFICSGIIEDMADKVKEKLDENGFEIIKERHMGDWVGFAARPRII